MKEYLLKPIGKPRMTQRDKWKQRPCVLRYRAFKDHARKLGIEKQLQGSALMAKYEIKVPGSLSKKKKDELIGKLHDKKPDADNISKAIMDILTEDSQVAVLLVFKVWSDRDCITIYDNDQEFFESLSAINN